MVFRTSLSAFQEWLKCQQFYEYRYVEKLQPKVKEVAPQKGILLHDVLAGYYRGLAGGVERVESMAISIAYHARIYQPKLHALAQTAIMIGDETLAKQYLELWDSVERIAKRYFVTRGKTDTEMYDVIMVEERIEMNLHAGIVSTGVIDLVLRERERGLTWLVEHKSTTTVPENDHRIRDFQTLLYAVYLERARSLHVDGVLWNYLRTVEPRAPHRNKPTKSSPDGDFSVAAIDSTWEVYAATVLAGDDDPERYREAMQGKIGTELDTFFPRFENVIVASPVILLGDYVTAASNMRLATKQWAAGRSRPIRTLTQQCRWCSYFKLCEAAVTGGDERSIVGSYFTVGKDAKQNGASTREVVSDNDSTSDERTTSLDNWSL